MKHRFFVSLQHILTIVSVVFKSRWFKKPKRKTVDLNSFSSALHTIDDWKSIYFDNVKLVKWIEYRSFVGKVSSRVFRRLRVAPWRLQRHLPRKLNVSSRLAKTRFRACVVRCLVPGAVAVVVYMRGPSPWCCCSEYDHKKRKEKEP